MTAVPAECDLNQFDAAHETIAVLLPWYTRMVVVWIEQLPARLLASQNEGKGTQNAHANIRLGGMASPRNQQLHDAAVILFSHPPKECIAAKNHNFSVVNQSGGLLGKDHEVRKRCFYGRRIKALLFHLRFL